MDSRLQEQDKERARQIAELQAVVKIEQEKLLNKQKDNRIAELQAIVRLELEALLREEARE